MASPLQDATLRVEGFLLAQVGILVPMPPRFRQPLRRLVNTYGERRVMRAATISLELHARFDIQGEITAQSFCAALRELENIINLDSDYLSTGANTEARQPKTIATHGGKYGQVIK